MQTLDATTLVNQRYQIRGLIGEGSAGRVYEAFDTRLQTRVAVKQITRLSERRQRAFQREARILARLRHPGLPVVSDYFSDPHGSFLVMDLVEGPDLATLLERRGAPLSERMALEIADQLLQTLEYMHSQRPPVFHRAIKPSDIRLRPDGRVVLLDFGLASDEGPRATNGSTLNPYSRSLWYAAPEIIYRRPVDARSDIYALGATIYFMLTGRQPASTGERVGALLSQQPDPLPPAHEQNSRVSAEVAAILARAMALQADARFAGAAAMRRSLHASPPGQQLWGEPAARPPDPPASRPADPGARWVIALALLLALVGVAALLLLVALLG